jgi:hypothetical protein
MATYNITNIKLKTSRVQAFVAVKKYFNLYDLPVTQSVEKLDAILRDGVTVESMVQVEKFKALNVFTFDLEEIQSESELWEKEQDAKRELAYQWYKTLSPAHREFVDVLRGEYIARA